MLGFRPTEFAEGLRIMYRAYLKKRTFDKPDFTFEDELIARLAPHVGDIRSA
jgi:hypothetical protein